MSSYVAKSLKEVLMRYPYIIIESANTVSADTWNIYWRVQSTLLLDFFSALVLKSPPGEVPFQ